MTFFEISGVRENRLDDGQLAALDAARDLDLRPRA
jgi:hypothetical protein